MIRPRSAETDDLIKHLGAMKMGDEVSYSLLSSIAKKTITSQSSSLKTARERLLTDKKIQFVALPNYGLRRTTDEEAVNISSRDVGGLRRKARKSKKKVDTATYMKLDFHQKTTFAVNRSLFVMIEEAAHARGRKKIEKKAIGAFDLPFKETLEALLK